jgi:hypothetical protein
LPLSASIVPLPKVSNPLLSVNTHNNKGPLKFVVNQYIPPILFAGAYEAIIKPHDQNGQEVFCVDVQFNLVSAETKAPQLLYQ